MATQVLNPIPPDEPSRGEAGKGKLRPEPIDMNTTNAAGPSQGPKTPGVARDRDRSRKIGHRRVDQSGQVTYKKSIYNLYGRPLGPETEFWLHPYYRKSLLEYLWGKDLDHKYDGKRKPTSELMAAIQLGIGQSIGGLAAKPERDVLMQDFAVVESVFFPSEGSNLTPAHHYSDYRFKTYAPLAFRYFRELFGIQPDDFMLSLCDEAMVELSNPGASGSVFYITSDDEFIVKTVQHKEADFLQKLLPGYYMNLNQNPRTLLPKFYGLYCYQCGGKNIRFVIMNNLLPSSIKLHEKYDLKGSTYKRKASKGERSKPCPTLKDLDFQDIHSEGLILEKETYDALVKTMLRDCMVLESFKIMDYSFLLGVHNLDADRPRMLSEDSSREPISPTESMYPSTSESEAPPSGPGKANLQRGKSLRTRLAQYSTALEAIQANAEPVELDNEDVPLGGIPARNTRGERLLLYVGIIDILQSYRLKKKLEHSMKAILTDGDTVSVHRPSFYSQRFQQFFMHKVFKFVHTLDPPILKGMQRFRKLVHLALKHSPSKKKGVTAKVRAMTEIPEPRERTRLLSERTQRTISFSDETAGAMGGKPDLLPEDSTPPPTFSEAIATRTGPAIGSHRMEMRLTESSVLSQLATSTHMEYTDRYSRSEQSSRTQLTHDGNTSAVERTSPLEYQSGVRTNSALSMSESTPTHTDYTEGTASFTASSPSCSSDMLDAPVPEGHCSPSSSPVHASLTRPQTSSSTETSYASAVENLQNGEGEGDKGTEQQHQRRSMESSGAVYVDARTDPEDANDVDNVDDDSPIQVNSAPSQLPHDPSPLASSSNQSDSVRQPAPSMQRNSLPSHEKRCLKYVTRVSVSQSDLMPPPVAKHPISVSIGPPILHAQLPVVGNCGNGNYRGQTRSSGQSTEDRICSSRHVSTASLPAEVTDFSSEVDKILEEDWRNLTLSQLKEQRKKHKWRQFNSAADIRTSSTTLDRRSPAFISHGFGRTIIALPGFEKQYTPVKLQSYKTHDS